jgi:hypothetical protein
MFNYKIKNMRNTMLQEIRKYVENQGTLVQEDKFDQVPVHHLSEPVKARDKNIFYIGSDAVYSIEGIRLAYSDLKNNEIKDVYDRL